MKSKLLHSTVRLRRKTELSMLNCAALKLIICSFFPPSFWIIERKKIFKGFAFFPPIFLFRRRRKWRKPDGFIGRQTLFWVTRLCTDQCKIVVLMIIIISCLTSSSAPTSFSLSYYVDNSIHTTLLLFALYSSCIDYIFSNMGWIKTFYSILFYSISRLNTHPRVHQPVGFTFGNALCTEESHRFKRCTLKQL